MADRSRPSYAVARVNNACYLEGVGQEWTALWTQVRGAPISLTHEWVNAWWHHHEPDWELFVLVVYDRQGRLAGVAPWARFHHEFGPLKLRRLAFVGDYRAYRLREDILSTPEDRMGVWDALLAYLESERGEWDVLDLEALHCALPAQIPALHAPGRWYRLQDGRVDMTTGLPGSWPEYERQQLSHGFRQRLRNRFRKLEHDFPGEVCYRQVRELGEVELAIDALADLHRQRWHARGQHSSFDHEAFTGFHRELAEVALQRGWLRLHLIEVRGRPIAAQYGFLCNGCLLAYNAAFDAAYADYDPGQLVLALLIREGIADGAQELDLGPGAFEYKFRWASELVPEPRLVLAGTRPGHLWTLGAEGMHAAKELARKYVPEVMRERINHRRGRVAPA